MNWSSRCSACKTTDDQHEKRHREIAEILVKIKKLKAEEEVAEMDSLASKTAPKTPRTPLTARALNLVDGSLLDTPKTSKKERKAAKKAVRALERDKVVTRQDIEFVATVLHPSSEKEMAEDVEVEEAEGDADIKMNLKFNNSTCNSKAARHDYIIKNRERSDIDDGTIKNLLVAMDVDPRAKGKESELVHELTEAIKNDFVHFYDELKIVARNKAGFWRWAHKSAYRDLVENGKDWDAKHAKEADNHLTVPDERRQSEQSIDTEADDEPLAYCKGSIDSSAPPSVGTALTVPSTQSTSRKKILSVTTSTAAKKKAEPDEDGWMQVGKKAWKASPAGKLTLSSNGGLHHLAIKPKPSTWSFSDLE